MLESVSAITRNLRRVFTSASPHQYAAGLAWYPTAYGIAETFADRFDLPVEFVCKIIAGLSPQCSWERNLKRVEEYFLKGHSPGLPLAESGPKVEAFRESIFKKGKSLAVCVDRHMIAASMVDSVNDRILKRVFESPPRIWRIKRAVSIIAENEGLWPAQAQAIIWVVQRGTGESPATNHHPVQQVRDSVRGFGEGGNAGRSEGRVSPGRMVEQRIDGRSLPRPRRTQHAKPQGAKRKKGAQKGVRR